MDATAAVVVSGASRGLRRLLAPVEWVVLEDVALDAVADGAGALVAATSARAVAAHLGITPGAAARALARLRGEGLVTHAQVAGPAGRFGLSAYLLGVVPGLEVVVSDVPAGVGLGTTAPRAASPSAASPRAASPRAASPRAAVRHMASATTIVAAPAPTATEQLALLTEPPTAGPRP